MSDYKFNVKGLDLYYGDFHALKDINMEIKSNMVTAFIGPSGCGKSTFLKTLNRMNDLVDNCKITGDVLLDDVDIYGKMDVCELRKRVGMVFQKPNPFPMSIYDNIAFGPRTHGIKSKSALDEIVEQSLKNAAIWDEVKDRLKKSALGLSGGQQQRLCIARALAVKPEVILMDEPTSALDPISTSKIEDLVMELKKQYTIVMVTHNMQQATRVADETVFFLLGEIIEHNNTEAMFSMPKSIEKAINALINSNVEEAKKAIEEDDKIDQAKKDIESLCMKLLLTQQPVASDLRHISSALKMVTDLERIGDHAADISEITILLSRMEYTSDLDILKRMAVKTTEMVIRSLEAFSEGNVEKAKEVINDDDIVDELFLNVKDNVISIISSNPNKGGEATDLLMIGKYFERIGDHATNIAEWAIYSVQGDINVVQ